MAKIDLPDVQVATVVHLEGPTETFIHDDDDRKVLIDRVTCCQEGFDLDIQFIGSGLVLKKDGTPGTRRAEDLSLRIAEFDADLLKAVRAVLADAFRGYALAEFGLYELDD